MPKIVYDYLYVNLWILILLVIMWTGDHIISASEAMILIFAAFVGIAYVAKKQSRTRTPGSS